MELEPEEKALVESYLRASSRPNVRWMVEVAGGVLVCVVAVLLLLFARHSMRPSYALLIFVLGLAIMAWGFDDRKKTVLARIIQKYDRALRESGAGQQ